MKAEGKRLIEMVRKGIPDREIMKQLLTKAFLIASVIVSLVSWSGLPAAEEKSVVEEILDILREKGQITDEQYREMKERAEAEKEELKGKERDFDVYWKDGIRMDSKDGNFKIKMGGRIQLDVAGITSDDDDFVRAVEAAEGEDLEGFGVEFRRARLYIEGTVHDSVDFKAQYDFAGGDADFKSVYLGLRKLPVIGHLKVGHVDEPFSLEQLTSSKYITFMERALPNVFVPSRNTGVMGHNTALENRLYWGVGAFEDVDDFGDSFNDFSDWNITARLTGLPLHADKGSKLLHLGLSYSHQFRDDSKFDLRYRARPEAHITDARTVNTGNFKVDNVDLINPEAAFVWGPLSLQGEYFHSFTDSREADDPQFSGFYVYASYFLTGEHRTYKTSAGAFDRVRPKTNFHPTKGGWGAWELGLRYSYLDLNDEGIRGGEESNITAGVNWYLNPNTRVMFNYVYADVEDRENFDDGDLHIVQSRFQIDF